RQGSCGSGGNGLVRSGVMKMPLITASHLLAPSAGSRPGNAVLTGFDPPPHCLPIAFAMSMSNPTIEPLVVADSIGGKVGSVQNLSDWPAAPAETGIASAAARARNMVVRLLDPSST